MTTIYRIIRYEGSDEWLARTLDRAIHGIKDLPVGAAITGATVDPEDAGMIGFCRSRTMELQASLVEKV